MCDTAHWTNSLGAGLVTECHQEGYDRSWTFVDDSHTTKTELQNYKIKESI